MPRNPRITLQNFPHLVIAKANGQECLFLDENDYSYYLEALRQMVKERFLKVYAYCLMPTELRLVVLPTRLMLSKSIQKMHLRYTFYINKKRSRAGHLFNGRFKSLVFSNENLPKVIRSVHLWPYRIGQITRANNYEFSSYKSYINNSNNKIDFLDKEEILSCFGQNESEQRRAFFNFIETSALEKDDYGVEEFFQGIGGDDEALLKKAKIDILNEPKISLSTLAEQTSLMLNVSLTHLLTKSRRQDLVMARRLFATVAVLIAKKSITELSIFLNKDKSQISRLVSQGMELLESDKPFSLMFEELRPKNTVVYFNDWTKSMTSLNS